MGCWELGMLEPDLFTALVPVAAYHKGSLRYQIAEAKKIAFWAMLFLKYSGGVSGLKSILRLHSPWIWTLHLWSISSVQALKSMPILAVHSEQDPGVERVQRLAKSPTAYSRMWTEELCLSKSLQFGDLHCSCLKSYIFAAGRIQRVLFQKRSSCTKSCWTWELRWEWTFATLHILTCTSLTWNFRMSLKLGRSCQQTLWNWKSS